jgi:hemerythrin superfamily protein
MVEHAAIRLHLMSIRNSIETSDSIYELDEFVVKCHARIEDEIVFPELKRLLQSSEQGRGLEQTLSRIEADHRLIQKISELIKSATEQGESGVLRKRIMLYCTTVESHNLAEESMIFPHWRNEQLLGAESKRIIDGFGRERYFRITGISEKLFDAIA